MTYEAWVIGLTAKLSHYAITIPTDSILETLHKKGLTVQEAFDACVRLNSGWSLGQVLREAVRELNREIANDR